MSHYEYKTNNFGQRMSLVQRGAAYSMEIAYQLKYNEQGELVKAKNLNDISKNHAYKFDFIGNRIWATQGGEVESAMLDEPNPLADVIRKYTSNEVNQYTKIEKNGVSDDLSFDLNGNMLADGKGNNYTWDQELRLKKIKKANGTEIKYIYDGMGRRVKRELWVKEVFKSLHLYFYDDWNLISEKEYIPEGLGVILKSRRNYVWGQDISNSLQGAGGIGGLLSSILEDRDTGVRKVFYYTYDGNGNVSEVLDKAGSIGAHYEYDPFGNQIASFGELAELNHWRFSTKPLDIEAGLYYYGYRFYSADLGRWINRDPLEEKGGANLYGMVGNNVMNCVDYLGLEELVHSTTSMNVALEIVENGLKPGSYPNIWMAEPGLAPSNGINLHYDMNISGAKELPCEVIKEALKAGKQTKGGRAMGLAIWNHVNTWIKQQGGVWKVPVNAQGKLVQTGKPAGYYYAFSSVDAWKQAQPRLMKSFKLKLPKYLKIGGRVLVAIALVSDAYEIYTAEDKPRTIASIAGGWAGAAAIAWCGAKAGAFVGGSIGTFFFGAGAVPGAAIGGAIGGIVGGVGGYFAGRKATEVVYDAIIEKGFAYY